MGLVRTIQKKWIVPIPGKRKIERPEENSATTILELTQYYFAGINAASLKIVVVQINPDFRFYSFFFLFNELKWTISDSCPSYLHDLYIILNNQRNKSNLFNYFSGTFGIIIDTYNDNQNKLQTLKHRQERGGTILENDLYIYISYLITGC